MSIVALYYLIRLSVHHRRSWQHWLSLSVYGFSLLILYALSTTYHLAGLYHGGHSERMKPYRVLDHIGIFYLIAGTYTPLMLLNTHQTERNLSMYLVLSFVWCCAFTGTALKLILPIDVMPLWISAALYLAMGFSIVVVIKPVLLRFPRLIMLWVATGGFLYSFGIIFLLWDSLHYNHSIWHMFVMGGSATHFVGVLLSTLPQQDRARLVNVAYKEGRAIASRILNESESGVKQPESTDERLC